MILKISLYVLIAILIIVAIVVIIWRIINRKQIQQEIDKTKIGHVSKKMIEQTEFFAKSNNIEAIVNILVKNTFSKKHFSLIPALFVTDKKAYIMTDMLNTKGYDKIIIKDQKFNSAFGIKNNKEFPIANFNLVWYKEIFKFVQKHVQNCELIITLENKNLEVINASQFKVLTFQEFENYIKLDNSEIQANNWNKKKIIDKFIAMNRWPKDKNDI